MPTLRVSRARIYYEVHGDGRSVVFLSGAGGSTLIWYQQVPFFSEHHTVVCVDPRGSRRSVCDQTDLELGLAADDLRAVLDAEGIERTAIVTHASGGYASMRMALEDPERVSCIVLCNSTGGIMSADVHRSLTGVTSEYQREGPLPTQALSPEFVRREPERAFLMMQLYGLNEPIDTGFVAAWVEAQVRREELTGFTTPTLMIGGGLDRLLGIDGLRQAATVIPGAKFIEFPDAALPYFEQPDEFNRVAAEFIALHQGI